MLRSSRGARRWHAPLAIARLARRARVSPTPDLALAYPARDARDEARDLPLHVIFAEGLADDAFLRENAEGIRLAARAALRRLRFRYGMRERRRLGVALHRGRCSTSLGSASLRAPRCGACYSAPGVSTAM
jgi:hypothetical protein